MNGKHKAIILLVTVAFLLVMSGVALGQESILSYTIAPDKVLIRPGGTASLQLLIGNKSLHPVDDIEVTLIDADGFSLDPAQANLKLVPPFGKATLDLNLVSSPDVAIGTHTLTLQVIYTYCIEVSCFQIVDSVSIPVLVSTVSIGPATVKKVHTLPKWVILAVMGALLIGAILLWQFANMRLPLYLALLLLVVGGLGYGVILGQHEQAQGIAAVLCTSCVGIEESQHEQPVLSDSALTSLAQVKSDVDLTVFYAPWCHSCPYAEAMVKEMAEVNSHIKYNFVNVDENRALAASKGIIRSKRTVVPAILRADTGQVIFGIDNLETRLLKLLGEG